jgi:predicted nucleic acid-binding protein
MLSGQTTQTQGGRAFDVLHVATAKLLGADTFLSFDGRQRDLAGLAGLTVAP